jgi:PAS domain S-box-containing protein
MKLNFLQFRSTRTAFIFIITPVLVGLTLVLILLGNYQDHKRSHQHLQSTADILTKSYSELLASPLWNVDTTRVQQLLDTIANDPDVAGTIVFDDTFAHFGSNGLLNGLPYNEVLEIAERIEKQEYTVKDSVFLHSGGDNPDFPFYGSIVRGTEIFFDTDAGSEKIGTMFIVMTAKDRIFQFNTKLKHDIFNILIITAAFIVTLLLVYSRTTSLPLKKLHDVILSIQKGDEHVVVSWESDDEIGQAIKAFNELQAQQSVFKKEILKSKEEWEKTFDSITDIVTLQNPDMQFVKINQAGCDSLGLVYDTILGKHCYELFHGSEEPCTGCPLLITKETFQPYSKEIYHEKMGKTFLVSAAPVLNEDGKLTHITHVAKDITNYKELEEERIRLAAAIDQASEVVMITDLEGTIQYVNPAFEHLTGYNRAETIGQNPRMLSSGKHDAQFFRKMWAELHQGNVWRGHLSNKKKDGSLFEEEATISPVKNNEGQITNFVAVKRDVSREKSLEKQLRHAMKMEAIGTLSSGIAHDFNNILAAILGYSEMAKSQLSSDDEQIIQDMDQVITAGNRAADLVKQILTFSRQGEEDFYPLKVQSIIKEVLKLLRSSLPTTIQLKENIASSTGLILADPSQIHQVLMNLCTNAKHAIGDEGGTLTVSLSEVCVSELEPIIDCPQLEHGTYLDFEVRDTGCGMDRLIQEKIFDPFFTTKKIGQGTGLGLSVVHGIIKQHKGEITVVSEPEQGTTFHIYLPVIDQEDVQAERVVMDSIPKGSERILLVDDEPVITHMLERVLIRLGYTVTVFSSSIEALEVYKKSPDDFDLVITDMTMPEMTGAELTSKLLALRPDLPVILCTGFSETIDEAKAKSLGIRGYVMKPIDKRTLANAIRKALKIS